MSEQDRESKLLNGVARGRKRERERGRERDCASYPFGERKRERGRDGGKGACATTMDRVCTPENWPAQKNRRLFLGMREKKNNEKTLIDAGRKGEEGGGIANRRTRVKYLQSCHADALHERVSIFQTR